jgi:hypothetical protein
MQAPLIPNVGNSKCRKASIRNSKYRNTSVRNSKYMYYGVSSAMINLPATLTFVACTQSVEQIKKAG